MSNFEKQVEEFRNYEAGWLDGDGVRFSPEGLDWLIAQYALYFKGREPYTYPMPCGSVQFEWQAGRFAPSLDIDLGKRSGYWHNFNYDSKWDEELNIDLGSEAGWQTLNFKLALIDEPLVLKMMGEIDKLKKVKQELEQLKQELAPILQHLQEEDRKMIML